ncbi:MAG: hypothetical protein GPOALKHO_001998 [Sodalis sp.]|uniref:hypothetical protein n=1 Tax=Sodalis sp. (in: enterobacteria) TaxID=1898979 RepID=UPI0038732AE7|nr:MAG: hypothetical protein GPOALKHO_001998 [Sodalis sp.]
MRIAVLFSTGSSTSWISNEINNYQPLYAFISTRSVLDVSVNAMRMAPYFEYGLDEG